MDRLAARYPWPEVCPDVQPKLANNEPFGWFNGQNRGVLKKLLSDDTRVVLELGALLGLSTLYMAQWAPKATVITIDHWQGSREHQKYPPLADVLDKLFEVFCLHLWEHRHHVIPVRSTTLAGMIELHDLDIVPEIVYVDAAHETGPAYADTMLAMTLWPNAHIVGDDGCWETIQAALRDVQRNTERKVTNHSCCWEIPPRHK